MQFSGKLLVTTITSAAVIGTLGIGLAVTRSPEKLVVATESGKLRGAAVDGVHQFLGVPYAASPTGERRWRAPEPAPRWRGIRDATEPGPFCPQLPSPLSGGLGSTDEDCLRLNVHVPADRGPRKLPVIVWLHAPSDSGSGNLYGVGPMVAGDDTILVTVNFRLGIFGFLAHPELSAEAGQVGSGSYGILDQQAALRWVQRNIGAFGGDKKRVTLAGQSDGATDVCAHLASPLAAGLFQRAIIQSGLCAIPLATRAQGEARGTALAEAAGCGAATEVVACLRGVAVEDLLEVGEEGGWGPVVGGSVLPRQIPEAIGTGDINRVPVIHGTTHDEGAFLVANDLGERRLTEEEYEQQMAARFGELAPQVLLEYPADAYDMPELALTAVITDSVFSCPVRGLNTELARSVPVYEYEFDDPNAPLFLTLPHAFPLGSYHTVELQYQFVFPVPMPPLDDRQRQLAELMGSYWRSFASTADPNRAGAPDWPRFQGVAEQIRSLSPAGPPLASDFDIDHHCGFWAALQGG